MYYDYNCPLKPHDHYYFSKAIKILTALAHDKHNPRAVLQIITQHGIDAKEQLYLLEYYYRQRGLLRAKHKYNPVTAQEEQEILELYRAGVPLLHIAKKLNRHVSTIYYVVKRNF